MTLSLPDYVRQLDANESFTFSCHSGVQCFTDCCRQLDLTLTPYDVLRLKKALGLTSNEFMGKYGIVEQAPNDILPQVYLTMIDDGRASCPFVGESGCTVYKDRPGACRTYPLGRGARQDACGAQEEFYVLLTEDHCRGFSETTAQNIEQWLEHQGLREYNRYNDLVMTVLQHERIQNGFRPSPIQGKQYLSTLYNLDKFRAAILDPQSELTNLPQTAEKEKISTDDTALLEFAVRWIKNELFND